MALTQTIVNGILISPVSGNDTEGGIISGSRLLLQTGDGMLLETSDYILKEN